MSNAALPPAPVIVVVDDDEDSRFFAERSLKRAFPSSRILLFDAPGPALDALRRGTVVHAIVTDHKLGHLSGCDFIADVRRLGHTFPVVMVTCSGDPNVASKACAAGATKVFETGGNEFAEFLKTALAAAETAPLGAA